MTTHERYGNGAATCRTSQDRPQAIRTADTVFGVSERARGLQPRQFLATDVHGQRSITGMATFYTRERLQRIRRAKKLTARPRNRLTDLLSYLHVLDELLGINHGIDFFTASDLVEQLDANKPMIQWDTVTVGKIVNDIAESIELQTGERLLDNTRKNGRSEYLMHMGNPLRIAMAILLDDLLALHEAGFEVPSGGDPLKYCKSLNYNRLRG